MADGTSEIIDAKARRRRWSLTEKLRIIAETEEPGATVRAVAARHDMFPGLLRMWRRQVREGHLSAAPQLYGPAQTASEWLRGLTLQLNPAGITGSLLTTGTLTLGAAKAS